MLNDTFRIRYGKVPLAVYCQSGTGDTQLHNHAEIEIIRIMGGSCTIFINGNEYSGQAGDVFFVNPLEVHSLQIGNCSEFSHQCICFEEKLIHDLQLQRGIKKEELRIRHFIKATQPESAFVQEAFTHILEVYTADDSYMEAEISSWLTLLVVHLAKYCMADTILTKDRNMRFCSEILQYIAENYREDITSKEAAAALSYNQCYFCRSFRRMFGMSFTEYLNQYRVGASRVLLERKEQTITKIALECGFRTSAHFTSCFKKYVGILPSQYVSGSRKVNTAWQMRQ